MKKLLWASLLCTAVGFGGDFSLTDVKGKTVSYASLRGDTTVVIFISTQCPVSNGYNERMNALHDDYSRRGVHFIFINANANESAAEVEEHARSHGFSF